MQFAPVVAQSGIGWSSIRTIGHQGISDISISESSLSRVVLPFSNVGSIPTVNCRRFPAHEIIIASSLALFSAGKRIAAKIAIIAITTKSSMRVKAEKSLARYAGAELFLLRHLDESQKQEFKHPSSDFLLCIGISPLFDFMINYRLSYDIFQASYNILHNLNIKFINWGLQLK